MNNRKHHDLPKRLLSLLLALLLTLSLVPMALADEADTDDPVDGPSNEEQVYTFLREQMGVNAAVASGIMANIQRESSFDPLAECIDTNKLTSFGLCQWNGSRYEALQAFCEERELDYTTIPAQLTYLLYELENSERYAYSKVKDLPDTADGAYMAGYNWARYFERCAHYSSSGTDMYEVRGKLSLNTYWPRYGNGGGCPSGQFTDVPMPHNWAHEGIDFAVSCELFTGISPTEFAPEGEMTRAMLVTVLWRYDGKPEPTGENTFTDIPNGRWYTDAVIWAAENGIVTGVGDGIFDPDGYVTRQQIAAILFRDAQRRGCDVSGRADLSKFADLADVSGYAKEPLRWAVKNELVNGIKMEDDITMLDPLGNATRAQVAAILYRYVKNLIMY